MASDLNPLPVPASIVEDIQKLSNNMCEVETVLTNTNKNMASDLNPLPDPAPNAEVVQNISNYICEGVTQLILWRNWRKSILVFAVLQSIIYDLSSESALSVLNVWAVTGLWITIFYRLYVRFLQLINKTNIQGNPYQKYLDMDISISAEQSKELGLVISTKIFEHLDKLRAILLVKSAWESFKWFVFLFGMALIMKSINFTILFQFVLVFLFTIPKMYEKKSLIMKFLKLRNCNVEVKPAQLIIRSETQDEMDIISPKHSEKEFGNIILKKEEGTKNSINSDVIHEPCAGGENIAICKSEEETQDEMDMISSKHSEKEFGNIILKKEVSKNSIDSDVIQEPSAGGDNIAICKSKEEASDEFERLCRFLVG
ncbi:reticulon-2 [Drosophila suzukii]|uniref:Reticulon-like protein n=1 Tax=Drosophila suzukii TaxID=28584 RepID=A0ABM4TPE7_DROSZ